MKHNPHDTRAELLRAALTCFAARGYDGASMRMIAEEARRPISIFAHYFGNKEGLYMAVFTWIIENYLPVKSPSPKPSATPRNREEALAMLREQIHHLHVESSLDFRANDPVFKDATRLVLQEVGDPRPSLHELLSRHFAPRTEVLRQCIRFLRPDLDDRGVVFFGISILGMIAGHGFMHGMNKVIWNSGEVFENSFQNSEMLADLCLHGLLGVAVPIGTR